jgi:hypothetical protein
MAVLPGRVKIFDANLDSAGRPAYRAAFASGPAPR